MDLVLRGQCKGGIEGGKLLVLYRLACIQANNALLWVHPRIIRRPIKTIPFPDRGVKHNKFSNQICCVPKVMDLTLDSRL